MKPGKFEYYRASNLQEAVQFMGEHGEECKIIAGGQSLVPLLNMRIAEPRCLLDISSLSELDYITEKDGIIRIGALTKQRTLETSEIIHKRAPVLLEAVKNIGHPQTRSRGTVGGSLAHAEPSAEIALAMLALDAEVTIAGSSGFRKVPIGEFLVSEFTTALSENEILTEVSFDSTSIHSGYAFEEFSFRRGDFAIASAISLVTTGSGGVIERARVTIGGIDSRPVIIEEAEDILKGSKFSNSLIIEICSIIEKIANVGDDMHSSSEYKLNLAKVMFEKSFKRAYEMAIALEVRH